MLNIERAQLLSQMPQVEKALAAENNKRNRKAKQDLLDRLSYINRRLAELTKEMDAARAATGECPLIFTLRSEQEGGAKTALDPTIVGQLLSSAAKSRNFDFVDVELSLASGLMQAVIDIAHRHDVQVIASSHHVEDTPSEDRIVDLLTRAATVGADAAKVAVMPKTTADVLRLLAATERASRELSLPLITMAMGSLGVVTRVFGGLFGSALTFASGAQSSAPGQLPIETLRAILETVRQLEK